MEESYQRYGDRVSFVWVYGNEAHPEEHPFSEGFESSDLGWEHPYTITRAMEERAERARWLKSDPEPDLEIPFLIDFVGSPPHQDDEIRRSYFGGGFYSGAVIDCDGTILDSHQWGWFAPGGEWWGLPLAPIDALHGLLDDYLANPPACYGAGGDGGPRDAGPSDSDAGEPTEVGPTEADAESSIAPGSSGSGCSISGGPSAAPWWGLALLGAIGLWRRRQAGARQARQVESAPPG